MSTLKTRLEATTRCAERIRKALRVLQEANGHRVHFRPSATGVAMVGLTPDKPQRGKSGIQNLERLAKKFEEEFKTHCIDPVQGRDTPEKELQSFLIRNALSKARRMTSLESAVGAGAALLFITDELSLPDDEGKVVCDLLALRGEDTPVIIELKSSRDRGRLVYQLERFAQAMDDNPEEFSRLYSAVLGRTVTLRNAAEKWLVWPPPAKGDRGPGDDEIPDNIEVFVYRPASHGEYRLKLVP